MHTLEQFIHESRQLHRQRVAFILCAGIIVFLLFSLLDSFLWPIHFQELLHDRIVAVGICSILLVVNGYDRALRLSLVIGFSGYLTVGIVILLSVFRLGGLASPYYIGLIIAIALYTALAPLTVGQTLISGLSLAFLYALSIWLAEEPLSSDQGMLLFNNLFFIVCFVLIAATQSWTDTVARSREHHLRASENRAAEILAHQADKLEKEVQRRFEAQQVSENQYQALYQAIADDVVLLTPQGEVRQANSSYIRHFSNGPLRSGASFLDIVCQEDRQGMRDALADLVATGKALTHLHLTLVSIQGQAIETEISGALLRRGETILGAQLVIRDITVRNNLEARLIASLRKVRQTENATIMALAKLSEYRDITPGHHLERIREYCVTLASELARRHQFAATLTPAYIQNLYQAAILHDIGKVAVSDDILAKTGRLTRWEEEELRNHTLSGGDVIKAMEQEATGSGFLSLAKNIAYFHHERWDGRGYPYGLQQTEIPLEARIMALADAYEEWTAALDPDNRLTHEQASGAIVRNSGHQFDPIIVDAFVVLSETFDRIRHEMAEPV
ncbi:MAG: HD domain-containing protein [Desulfobulbus sp.]|jgi:HD-GYP domain-containing protein (c-di-GMP phosphodiesterase class II)|uniref:HD domain-containing phosphohydrolase n=1 Tax=Desulfobulbus sp. TaxID=895 RepID=UPI0028410E1B|nr:HD domain-containing phosphohydrolase [Desulfobulbus sp.]MDR2551170.1 HD domain-containing protein [Desulfobulbus sp.]